MVRSGFFVFLLACLLLVPVSIYCGDDGGLSKDEFDAILGRTSIFGMFFAPWCGHCKTLAPIWVKLMKHFETEDRIKIFMVNAESQTELAKEFDVTGYPTILYLEQGYVRGSSSHSPEVYTGKRTLQALVDYVNSKAGTRRRADGTLVGQVKEVDEVIGAVECGGDLPLWECAGLMHSAMEEKGFLWKFPVEGEWTQKFVNYYNQFLKNVHTGKRDLEWLKNEIARLEVVVSKYRSSVDRDSFDFFQGRIEVLGHLIKLFDPSFVPPVIDFNVASGAAVDGTAADALHKPPTPPKAREDIPEKGSRDEL